METGSPPPLRTQSRRGRLWLGLVGVCVVLVAVPAVKYRQKYPYCWSHCCIDQLTRALLMYAEDHDGRFPAGEKTPEACLSLLYKVKFPDGFPYAGPYLLRGMTVSERTTRRILERGELLGPESCGWHYVPGLTTNDDSAIALVWCKAPLFHNGEYQKDGGRQVGYLSGMVEYVPGHKWAAFLREQELLLSSRSNPPPNAVPGP